MIPCNTRESTPAGMWIFEAIFSKIREEHTTVLDISRPYPSIDASLGLCTLYIFEEPRVKHPPRGCVILRVT